MEGGCEIWKNGPHLTDMSQSTHLQTPGLMSTIYLKFNNNMIYRKRIDTLPSLKISTILCRNPTYEGIRCSGDALRERNRNGGKKTDVFHKSTLVQQPNGAERRLITIPH